VARAALAHADGLLATVADLRAERDALVGWLRGRGLTAADSDANFVLFGRFGDSHAVWQGLLDRGVLVREVGPPGWLRVSIGTPAEMAAFRDALAGVLDSTQSGSRGVARPGQQGPGPVTEEPGRRPSGGSRGVAPPGQHGHDEHEHDMQYGSPSHP